MSSSFLAHAFNRGTPDSEEFTELTVSIHRGTPVYIPKYNNPYSRDPQNNSLILADPTYTPNCISLYDPDNPFKNTKLKETP